MGLVISTPVSNANTLEVKAKLLGLDNAKKAEILTKLYKGKIRFMLDTESNLIYIDKVDSSINVLELPELPCFDFKFLIFLDNALHKSLSTCSTCSKSSS